jgi:hypothetical protein
MPTMGMHEVVPVTGGDLAVHTFCGLRLHED